MSSTDVAQSRTVLNGAKRARSEETELSNGGKRSKLENAESGAALDKGQPNPTKDKRKRKKKKKRKSSVTGTIIAPMVASGSSTRLEDLPADSIDKGKVKPPAESSESAQIIANLTRQLAAQNKATQIPSTRRLLVEKHQNLLGQIQSTLTCKICLDLMFKPYVLAPCGHTSCYQCLVSWFTAPPSDQGPHPPVQNRKKTCPHCRASIRERPVECYDIKTAVSSIVKSALVPGLDATPMPFVNPNNLILPPANAPPANNDPWAGIFRNAPTHPYGFDYLDAMGDGFFGLDPPGGHHDHPDAAMGIIDPEDGGIYRCIDCLHEIWDGACSQCGRVYPGHDDDWSEGDGSEDDGIDLLQDPGWMGAVVPHAHHWLFAGLHDGDDDNDSDEEGDSVGGAHGRIRVVRDRNEEDSEDDDESLEGSFIDDEDVIPLPPSRRREGSTIIISSDSDSSSDDEDDAPPPPQTRRSRRGPIIIDDESDEEAEGDPRKRAGAAALRRAEAIVVDGNDDEVEVIDPPPHRNKGKGRQRVVDSDEEDVEDSEPPKIKTIEAENVEDSDESGSGRVLAERIAAEEREMYGDDGSTSRVPKAFRQFADARRAPPSNSMGGMFADEDEDREGDDDDDGEHVGDEMRAPWAESDGEDDE